MSKFEDDDRFDGLYLNVANTTRGIEPLLDTVFSFLRRKTDFFDGPTGSDDGSSAAFQMVNAVYQKHAQRFRADKEKSQNKRSTTSGKPTSKPTSKPSSSTTTTKKTTGSSQGDEGIVEMGKDGGFDISTASTPEPQTQAATSPAPSPSVSPDKDSESPSDKDKGNDQVENTEDDDDVEVPPLGNGGTVPGKYVWTQTLEEVLVNVPVPENTRGRDLHVTIARNHLKVGLRAQPKTWIVDSDLSKTVITDDSFWTVEDGNRLAINLQKQNQMEWWDSVCKDDPKIDVKKIRPENSSLSDLDGETRQTVEKMMYDQRARALGKPTSDEEQKFAMLEKFKAQHPELDFTNAKIN